MKRWSLVLLLAATPVWALNAGLSDPTKGVDRGSPQSALRGFLKAAHSNRYAEAAHYLDLDDLAPESQPQEGARLARRLRFVLDRQSWLRGVRLSNDPAGDPGHPDVAELGFIPLQSLQDAIRLRRVKTSDAEVWVFDRATVRSIDPLFEEYGPPFGDSMPEILTTGTFLKMELWQWLGLIAVFTLSILLGIGAERLTLGAVRRVLRWTRFKVDEAVTQAGRGVLRLPIISGLLALGASELLLPPTLAKGVALVTRSLSLVALGWFSVRFVNEGTDLIRSRLGRDSEADSYRARGLETQLTLMRRLLVVALYILTGALLLLQFQGVRSLGVSLLASAGVAGLAIGFAAQKSLSTVLAGIQLSLSQPIRIGDKVIVENEFGTVEEIRLTTVVVFLWDRRRMVLPITYFLEKPFQNWSKGGTQLLGAVMLEVDYFADVDAFRKETERILANEGKSLWDGQVQGVQVTDCSERTQTLRILASARDAAMAFDLRCIIRESLVRFLKAHPEWLPQQRTLALERKGGPNPAARVPAVPLPAALPSAAAAESRT